MDYNVYYIVVLLTGCHLYIQLYLTATNSQTDYTIQCC